MINLLQNVAASPKSNADLMLVYLEDDMKLSKHGKKFSLKLDDLHYFRKNICGAQVETSKRIRRHISYH